MGQINHLFTLIKNLTNFLENNNNDNKNNESR